MWWTIPHTESETLIGVNVITECLTFEQEAKRRRRGTDGMASLMNLNVGTRGETVPNAVNG